MSGSSAATETATVASLVSLALLQLGIGAPGTAAPSEAIAMGVQHLNMMLAQWQRRRWMVPTLVDVFALATGAPVITVGPSGNISLPVRPDEIEGAYARLLQAGAQPSVAGQFDPTFDSTQFVAGNVSGLAQPALIYDYPLALIPSHEDYSTISIKNLRTWPSYAYYSPDYPLGSLYVWPIPAIGVWEIHVLVKQPLPSGLGADDTINLPPEYQDAVMWSLAARLAPAAGQAANPVVATFARAALNTIRTANLQVPSLDVPAVLSGRGRAGGVPAYGGWAGGPVNLSALPTFDPGQPGTLWNNGGVVMVSGQGVLMSDGSTNG